MRRLLTLRLPAALLVSAVLVGACSGDDDTGGEAATTSTAAVPDGPRFCDAYLDYLGDSSPANLAIVDGAAADAEVSEYAAIITTPTSPIGAVLAATEDLDDLARLRCQPEWTAGAQGAGNTGAAAQALFDAVLAGDRIGAANVASANAIAVFEPWEPLSTDGDAGDAGIAEVGEAVFTLTLGDSLAVCQVETGVVIACQVS